MQGGLRLCAAEGSQLFVGLLVGRQVSRVQPWWELLIAVRRLAGVA